MIHGDIGEAAVRDKVVRPLAGLRVAPYYGCQWVRPMSDVDNPEYPMKMDELFTWLGAEVVDYPVKAHCCGGHMTQISEPQAFELIRRLLQSAVDYQADMILCMCPMCQLNLDAYQAPREQLLRRQFQDADHLLHADAGHRLRHRAQETGLRQGDRVRAMPVMQGEASERGRQCNGVVRSETVSGAEQIQERRTMAEKVGIYVCHCGSNIAGTVDVEEVARWAGENLAGRRRRARLQVHVLLARPADDRGGHPAGGTDAGGRGRLLAAPAREDLPPRLPERRPESLPAAR